MQPACTGSRCWKVTYLEFFKVFLRSNAGQLQNVRWSDSTCRNDYLPPCTNSLLATVANEVYAHCTFTFKHHLPQLSGSWVKHISCLFSQTNQLVRLKKKKKEGRFACLSVSRLSVCLTVPLFCSHSLSYKKASFWPKKFSVVNIVMPFSPWSLGTLVNHPGR